MTRLRFSLLCIAIFVMTSTPAFAVSTEDRKVDLGDQSKVDAASGAGGGGSFLRTIVGLLIVVGLIYGLYWFLRRMKGEPGSPKHSGSGLEQVASLPVGTGRSLHLVRVGTELVLVGSSEHGVTPIRRYGHQEALALGLERSDALDAEFSDADVELPTLEGDVVQPPVIDASPKHRPGGHDTFAARTLDNIRKSTVRR